MIKTICFDIDNVICSTTKNFYKKSKPIKKNINLINQLYNSGYFIKIFTYEENFQDFNRDEKLAEEFSLTLQILSNDYFYQKF